MCFEFNAVCVLINIAIITLFRSITMYSGTNNILWNIPHVQSKCREYFIIYCQSHRTLLWILIMLWFSISYLYSKKHHGFVIVETISSFLNCTQVTIANRWKWHKLLVWSRRWHGCNFGLFGSNVMTKCSIMNNGMNLRLRTWFGMSSLSTPKRPGTWCLNKLIIVASR